MSVEYGIFISPPLVDPVLKTRAFVASEVGVTLGPILFLCSLLGDIDVIIISNILEVRKKVVVSLDRSSLLNGFLVWRY